MLYDKCREIGIPYSSTEFSYAVGSRAALHVRFTSEDLGVYCNDRHTIRSFKFMGLRPAAPVALRTFGRTCFRPIRPPPCCTQVPVCKRDPHVPSKDSTPTALFFTCLCIL